LICGDFDSAPRSIIDFYHSLVRGAAIGSAVGIDRRCAVCVYDACAQGSELVPSNDQDSTDLDKCLSEIKTRFTAAAPHAPRIRTVLIYGAFGGRFDHTMANVQSLYKFES